MAAVSAPISDSGGSSLQSLSPAQLIRSAPWKLRDALIVFLLPWVVLPLIVVFLTGYLGDVLPAVSHFRTGLVQGQPGATFALVIIDAIGSFGAIGYFVRKYGVGLQTLGLRPFNPLTAVAYVLGILLTFSFLVLAAFWVAQLIDPSFNATQPQTNQFTGHYSLINLLALVVIPPLVEEPTFRGFIFPAFARRYGLVIGALITSALFGFAHLQGNVSVYTFILSLLLCWLYRRVGSIIPGIGLHMLNNYIAYISINQK